MLQMPKAVRSYPPEELRELLNRFGSQATEAIPILLQAARSDDYERRCWSVGGLKVTPSRGCAWVRESPGRYAR